MTATDYSRSCKIKLYYLEDFGLHSFTFKFKRNKSWTSQEAHDFLERVKIVTSEQWTCMSHPLTKHPQISSPKIYEDLRRRASCISEMLSASSEDPSTPSATQDSREYKVTLYPAIPVRNFDIGPSESAPKPISAHRELSDGSEGASESKEAECRSKSTKGSVFSITYSGNLAPGRITAQDPKKLETSSKLTSHTFGCQEKRKLSKFKRVKRAVGKRFTWLKWQIKDKAMEGIAKVKERKIEFALRGVGKGISTLRHIKGVPAIPVAIAGGVCEIAGIFIQGWADYKKPPKPLIA